MTAPRRPGRPSSRPPLRRALAGLGAATAAVVLSGCTVFPSPTESPTAGGQNPVPTTSAEGFVALPLYFVALSGQYPAGATGRLVACDDLLLRVESVPVKTEEPVATAVDFLLDDEQYSHGDPALTNSLDPSEDGLAYSSHRIEGDTVTVELAGDVVARGQCEAFRLRAQLNRTAADAAGVPNAEILVDGVRLDDLLGLPPLELGEVVTTPDAEQPETEDGGQDGTGEVPQDELADPAEVDGTQG